MIVSWLKGRIGNKMFCIAAGTKIARDLGYEFGGGFVFEKEKRLWVENGIDEYTRTHILRKVNILSAADYIGRKDYAIYPYVPNDYMKPGFSIPQRDNLILNAYFQDVKYIDKDIAYGLFAPFDSIIDEIQSTYGDLSNYVCVHVRRGDYKLLGGLGFRIIGKEFIDRCLEKHFPDAEVMFISDDLEWCKANFIGSRYHFADKPCTNYQEMDLYIQTQCGRGNLISNSTFSWWGAYLNANEGRKVVVPVPWYRNRYLDGGNCIIPDGWIREEGG